MDKINLELLKQIADLDGIPQGAYNFRINGKGEGRRSTDEIEIVSKKDKPGIDIYIKPNTKGKSVHIPVMISQAGLNDLVYNDFYVGKNCDVTIVAGCGIYNCSNSLSEHDGIHTFHIESGAKVKYVEKHLGLGTENAQRVLNPTTKVFIKKDGFMEMETTQIGGVSFADRKTFAKLVDGARLVIKEKILTTQNQTAKTKFQVSLVGKKSSVDVLSRSVAKEDSKQNFKSIVIGKNECFGHVECDGIIIGNGKIVSTPEIRAEHIESTLVHEAAIGKIAGDEIVKLQTLGLTEKQAEDEIIASFMLEN